MLREMIDGLDVDHPLPLYQQLQRSIRQAIHRQALGPGDALPAERDIAEELEISRITVRKALDGLVGEGLLTRRQGAGTFVTARVEKSFSKLSSFTEDMRARGVRPHSEWLTRACGSVTPDEAMMLGLSPGAAVLRFHRIRFGDDKPMALEYSSVPTRYISSPEGVGESLYAALRKVGARPTRALQRLRAVLFTTEQADLLGIAPASSGLLIERRAFLSNGQPVEFTRSYYRGDAYDFIAELNAA
jgi:GntR family transcriptional regulator